MRNHVIDKSSKAPAFVDLKYSEWSKLSKSVIYSISFNPKYRTVKLDSASNSKTLSSCALLSSFFTEFESTTIVVYLLGLLSFRLSELTNQNKTLPRLRNHNATDDGNVDVRSF